MRAGSNEDFYYGDYYLDGCWLGPGSFKYNQLQASDKDDDYTFYCKSCVQPSVEDDLFFNTIPGVPKGRALW